MSSDPTGGPAFPTLVISGEDLAIHSDYIGMSLRDYFAGQAFQTGLIDMDRRGILKHDDHAGWNAAYRAIAKASYEAADAMLAARNP